MLTRSLLSGQSIRQSDVRNVMLMTETLPASRPTIRAEDSCDDGLRVCSANHHAVSTSGVFLCILYPDRLHLKQVPSGGIASTNYRCNRRRGFDRSLTLRKGSLARKED
jgi:hypothetical protein